MVHHGINNMNNKILVKTNGKSFTSLSNSHNGQIHHQRIDDRCFSYEGFLRFVFLVKKSDMYYKSYLKNIEWKILTLIDLLYKVYKRPVKYNSGK